ncbi:hypothetical protein PR202_gb02225 [Eleusine coracana subsp. coracana]|uniref:DUF6598 domain-containing protein n=1 Tax=Eleusine coracana subsp. coracana TaxID=191504 RepID=A0AAV5DX81_ELECO|nr:hypothetical protein PR202_gb02225 [Eleusine coracana subsp. coracana]
MDDHHVDGLNLDHFVGFDSKLDPNWNFGFDDRELDLDCNFGFDMELDPDWNNNHVESWEEHVVKAIHIVRLYQITENNDPAHHGIPVRTRFCRFNVAYFDLDKESAAPRRGPPILSLTSRDQQIKLADSINVVSLKILESDMGYPISVFGTVLVRDQEDTLTLTDPCRGLAITDGMFFEINLKVITRDDDDDDSAGVTDFSKGVIERDVYVSSATSDRGLMTRLLTSWHSTLQLAYTTVPSAVAATLAVNVLEGPRDFFDGEVTAWTSGNKNRILLYDSRMTGAITEIGQGGSVALTRCLVAVPVKEELMVRISVRQGALQAACFEFTLDHLDDDHICCRGPYELQVKVDWTAILNTGQEGVFRHVEHTQLLL